MNNIYRINKAGLYGIGHFGVFEIRLLIGQPDTCGSISLTQEQVKELLGYLRIDWEDGAYLADLLEGRLVAMGFDEKDCFRFVSIGDPYDNKKVVFG